LFIREILAARLYTLVVGGEVFPFVGVCVCSVVAVFAEIQEKEWSGVIWVMALNTAFIAA
jgi:hypothetical protein